jgi:predicted helicase
VSINLFVRLPPKDSVERRNAKILYHAVPVEWRKEQKYAFLEKAGQVAGIKWQRIKQDLQHTWLTGGMDSDFNQFIPVGSRETKGRTGQNVPLIFKSYSLGVSTNRDSIVYDFNSKSLLKRAQSFCEAYNAELHRWKKTCQSR